LRFESQGFWGKKIKQKFCQIAAKACQTTYNVTANALNWWLAIGAMTMHYNAYSSHQAPLIN
jgi:hypothetical protein